MRQHFARMLNQDAQEVIFFRRELYLLIANFHDAAHEIDRKIPNPENRPLSVRLQLMTHCGAHSRQKLVHAEWLGHIIVGTRVERLHFAGLIIAAGKDDNRDAIVMRTQGAQQLITLHIRQTEIENDDIRCLLVE